MRPGRDRLHGVVEVAEAYWGGEETGAIGRQTEDKAPIVVAAEKDGKGIGRIRLRTIPDAFSASLHRFIREGIELGSTIRSDNWSGYLGLEGYVYNRQAQSYQKAGEEHLLPGVHRVISLLRRWLPGTHQGSIRQAHLDDCWTNSPFASTAASRNLAANCSIDWRNRQYR